VVELFQSIWVFLEPIQELIYSVAIGVVTALLHWIFRAKVKVIWGSTSLNFHHFKLAPDREPISIATEKYFIQSMGKKEAREVEIVLSSLPTSYTLWPVRDHTTKLLENGNFIIHVPFLAPSELLIVDIIDLDLRNPKLVTVNCPDALTTPISFLPQRRFPPAVLWLSGYLMLAGFVGTIYLLLTFALG
jgi:hypothetical protein